MKECYPEEPSKQSKPRENMHAGEAKGFFLGHENLARKMTYIYAGNLWERSQSMLDLRAWKTRVVMLHPGNLVQGVPTRLLELGNDSIGGTLNLSL
ncbi:predicted protein [Nematostella vectensis]|uniref:Uncharacterized protein n=1 Tax=Nematostella vectensis TaxID=45351 RepID=A7RR83_NEMVE|nr:predicted protein [Nematostella vectensis]|eukprot:XP_001638131.1 predicted protein [Nematostella vectensis]